jgi:hypothetical protein
VKDIRKAPEELEYRAGKHLMLKKKRVFSMLEAELQFLEFERPGKEMEINFENDPWIFGEVVFFEELLLIRQQNCWNC